MVPRLNILKRPIYAVLDEDFDKTTLLKAQIKILIDKNLVVARNTTNEQQYNHLMLRMCLQVAAHKFRDEGEKRRSSWRDPLIDLSGE